MKILVTGGAGYIGATLVPMLLDKGYEVTVYDQLICGIDPLFHVANNENLKIVKGDIRDRDTLTQVIAGMDGIIHLAAIVGYPACDKDPQSAVETNVWGTKNIAELKQKDTILIYASTGSCYGKVESVCSEDSKLNPISLYAKTKSEGEVFVKSVSGIVLRLATLYGLSPRMRLDLLINDLTYKAVHTNKLEIYQGHFQRTFLHVKDAARAFMFALHNARTMCGHVFNIGDSQLNVTKYEAAQIIQRFVPGCIITCSELGSDKDVRNYKVSYEKIGRMGYRSLVSIEEGVSELIKVLPLLSIDNSSKYSNV